MIFKTKENKGITLIALVITIIVMLILVGVTINVAMQGGLFDTGRKAAKDTQIEVDKETLQGAVVAAYNVETGEIESGQKILDNLPKGWTVEEEGLYTCKSPNGNIFTVDIKGKIEETIDISKLPENSLVRMYKEGRLKQGDYVTYTADTRTQGYDPDEGRGAGGLTGLTDEIAVSKFSLANGTQSITQENLNWRVLGYDEGRNEILLISGAPTKQGLYFYGHVGYNNYENVLNKMCNNLYSKEGIGTGRSMTMEDIDEYLDGRNYDKTQYGGGSTQFGGYGYSKEFTNIYHPNQWDRTWSGTLTSNEYYYTIDDYITDPIKQEILKGKPQYQTKGTYYNYLASRFVYVNSSGANWGIGYVR